MSITWLENNDTLGTDATLTKNDFTLGTHNIVLKIANNGKTASDSKMIKVSQFLVSSNVEQAVVTRYGIGKFGKNPGEVLATVIAVQSDSTVSKRKNVGLRCVREAQ